MKTIKQHYQEELGIIRERRKHYTDWGCTPELSPIVTILYDAEKKLESELNNLQ